MLNASGIISQLFKVRFVIIIIIYEMSSLSKKQTQQFRIAIKKCNSNSKLMAKDLLKLKTPIYKDYLLHVKRCAGTPILKKQKLFKQEQQQIEKTPRLKNNSSYYYCQRNQLLSLKQFIILMQQSQKKTERDQKLMKRRQEKNLAKSVQKQLQQNNTINLRLTSSYAKRLLQNQRKSIF